MKRLSSLVFGAAIGLASAPASAQQGGPGVQGGAIGQRTEPWTLFTSGSLLSTLEATNSRLTSDLESAGSVDQQVTEETQTFAGYVAAAVVGASWLTPISDTLMAYTLGAQVTDDLGVQPEDIVQAIFVQSRITPNAQLSINFGGNLFWGVFRSEQDLAAANLDPSLIAGRVPGAGQTPEPPVDGQPQDPQVQQPTQDNPFSDVQAQVISIVRYVRHGEYLSIGYRATPRLEYGLQGGFTSQLFLDRDLIRDFELRLFDNYNLDLGLYSNYALSRRTRLGVIGRSQSGWFGAIDAEDDADLAGTQGFTGQISMDHQLSPLWQFNGNLGLNLIYPTDQPEQQSLGLLARAGVSYLWRQWRYQLDGFRTIQRSELGAVFDNLGASVSAFGQFRDRSNLRLTAAYIRQTPLVIVLAPGDDVTDPQGLIDSLESDTFQGSLNYLWQVSNQMVFSIAYNYNHRLSGTGGEDQQISHRFLFGLTINYPGGQTGGG